MNLESLEEQPVEAPNDKGTGQGQRILDGEVRRFLGGDFADYIEGEFGIEGCLLPDGEPDDSEIPVKPKSDQPEGQ